jgi:hypothetical protein
MPDDEDDEDVEELESIDDDDKKSGRPAVDWASLLVVVGAADLAA